MFISPFGDRYLSWHLMGTGCKILGIISGDNGDYALSVHIIEDGQENAVPMYSKTGLKSHAEGKAVFINALNNIVGGLKLIIQEVELDEECWVVEELDNRRY